MGWVSKEQSLRCGEAFALRGGKIEKVKKKIKKIKKEERKHHPFSCV